MTVVVADTGGTQIIKRRAIITIPVTHPGEGGDVVVNAYHLRGLYSYSNSEQTHKADNFS